MSAYLSPAPVIPYTISRGCYWGRCVFCQTRYGKHPMRKYQTVPVAKAISEISALSEQYETKQIHFNNDVIDPAYLKQFSQAVLDQGKRFFWNADLRAEKEFDEGLCRLMARAGLNSVSIGFESASQKVLDDMDKGLRVDVTRKILKVLYDAGVATQIIGFFGFPGETYQDGEESVCFIEKNLDRISYYHMSVMRVVPGSRIHDAPEKFGATTISYDNNLLKTPEPTWGSAARMSYQAVNHLFRRLIRIDEYIYPVNEEPYVGSFSSNHNFLYFEQGPDVLKRAKKEQIQRHMNRHVILGIDRNHNITKNAKSLMPEIIGDYLIYKSPFEYNKIQMDLSLPAQQDKLFSGKGWEYLIDPGHKPIAMGTLEKKAFQQIDGQRTLKSILSQVPRPAYGRLVYFFFLLMSHKLIVCRENPSTDSLA